MNPSWTSRPAQLGLRLLPKGLVGLAFAHPPRFPAPVLPRFVRRAMTTSSYAVGPAQVATATPGDALPGRHVVLLHGGAYVLTSPPAHWRVLLGLARRARCRVTYVEYPLAPEHTVTTTTEAVVGVWAELARRHPGDDLVLVGDSAGGGLALVLGQLLRDRGLTPRPARTALLSPWVDLAMTDAETIALDRVDRVLPRSGLLAAARRYAGGLPLEDPLLSPLNGDLSGLGDLLVLVSRAEQFLVQDRRLAELASASDGTTVVLHEHDGLPHDWPLFGLAEGAASLDEVAAFLYP
jgi:monoterpene epsilon-lactone hydrolase